MELKSTPHLLFQPCHALPTATIKSVPRPVTHPVLASQVSSAAPLPVQRDVPVTLILTSTGQAALNGMSAAATTTDEPTR